MGIGGWLLVGAFIGALLAIGKIASQSSAKAKGALKPNQIPESIRVSVPLKDHDENREVISSTSGNVYTVNLHRLTCTCPDQQRRQHYYPGDLRRHCKHINRQLSDLGLTENMPPLAATVVNEAHTVGHGMQLLDLKDRDGTEFQVLLGMQNNNEWVNVYGPSKDGEIKQFGFNVREKRWSYNTAPLNGDDLKQHILSLSA